MCSSSLQYKSYGRAGFFLLSTSSFELSEPTKA